MKGLHKRIANAVFTAEDSDDQLSDPLRIRDHRALRRPLAKSEAMGVEHPGGPGAFSGYFSSSESLNSV